MDVHRDLVGIYAVFGLAGTLLLRYGIPAAKAWLTHEREQRRLLREARSGEDTYYSQLHELRGKHNDVVARSEEQERKIRMLELLLEAERENRKETTERVEQRVKRLEEESVRPPAPAHAVDVVRLPRRPPPLKR